MADTLLLDRGSWDLLTDARGNIAVASAPYAQTQDAASAARVFDGECFYDTTLGLPYFSDILGHTRPVQIFKAKAVEAAKTVPGVSDARVFLTAFRDRTISGQLQIRTDAGIQGIAI